MKFFGISWNSHFTKPISKHRFEISHQDGLPVSIQQRKPVSDVKQVYHKPPFYFHSILGNVHVILCNIHTWLVDGSNNRKDYCQRCNCEYL